MTRKTYKGFYTVINPKKYVGDIKNVVFRSLWERKLCVFSDKSNSVLKWASEPVAIPYYSEIDHKMHRYFPDFIIQYKNKKDEIVIDLIEVKPYKETMAPVKGRGKNAKGNFIQASITFKRNSEKWAAAEIYADKHNMSFRIMTEHELGIKY
jgi:hypothetical protein